MSPREVGKMLEDIRKVYPMPTVRIPVADGEAITPPDSSYHMIVLPGDKRCDFETILRVLAHATGAPANEEVGPSRFGWNDASVAALEKRFDKIMSEKRSVEEKFYQIAVCIGDYTMAYIGGNWVYLNGKEPHEDDTGMDRGEILVRFAQKHNPPNFKSDAVFPENHLFNPFLTVSLWLNQKIPTPFQPLMDMFGPPPLVAALVTPYRIPPPPNPKPQQEPDAPRLTRMKPVTKGRRR